MPTLTSETFGNQDASYKAAGEFAGIQQLVKCFYENMEALAEAETILKMHPEDLSLSKDKLTHFLSGWLGGPRSYTEKYGGINIPQVHRHLEIGEKERDAWLLCMQKAIGQQPYEASFKEYLYRQLCIPAERVYLTSKGRA